MEEFISLYERGKSDVMGKKLSSAVASPIGLIKINDEHHLLDDSLRELLQRCAFFPFHLGEYTSLANILKSLNVEVCIQKGIFIRTSTDLEDFINSALTYWKNQLNSESLDESDRRRIMGRLQRIMGEMQFLSSRIRGRYIRDEKRIELFIEEMHLEDAENAGAISILPDLLISTFVHEVMHAYFDRPGHESYPYAYFVEEPLAEFGMLLFLYETSMPKDLQQWAFKDVSGKSCYRYGAKLFAQYFHGDHNLRKYLAGYKYNMSKFEMLDVDNKEGTIHLPAFSVGRAGTSKGVKVIEPSSIKPTGMSGKSSGRDRTQYSINGHGSYGKNRLVAELIKLYVEKYSPKSPEQVFEEWKEFLTFYKHLIMLQPEYDALSEGYFKSRIEPIQCGGGKVYVPHDGFYGTEEIGKLIKAVHEKWGWTIEIKAVKKH